MDKFRHDAVVCADAIAVVNVIVSAPATVNAVVYADANVNASDSVDRFLANAGANAVARRQRQRIY